MRKRGLVAVVTLVAALVCTVGVGMANQKEAKACNYFKRTSVKKCAVTLSETEYVWDGTAKQPEVRVNYKGEDLEQGVDYTVQYINNVDAGQGTVTIKGTGDYRSKQRVRFNIRGLDIGTECEINIVGDKVQVFYQGHLLTEGYYAVNVIQQDRLIQSIPGPHGALNTYEVTKTYMIYGKGAFEGSINKEVKTTEIRYEEEGTY